MVARLQAGRSRVRIPTTAINFPLLLNVRTGFGVNQSPIKSVPVLFLGGKVAVACS
jgi:hypothetical protein